MELCSVLRGSNRYSVYISSPSTLIFCAIFIETAVFLLHLAILLPVFPS